MNIEYKSQFNEAINTVKDFDDMVEGLLKDSFDGMVENISSYINRIIDSYERNRVDDKESPYMWAKRIKYNNYPMEIIPSFYQQRNRMYPVVKIADRDITSKILKYSTKMAKEIQDSYKQRLYVKLFIILKAKPLKDVKVIRVDIREFYSAMFHFFFEDGSSFTLQSQIVISSSVYGKEFYRFPNIYQNIVMSDGTKIKKQSEEWMLINFAGKTANDIKQAKRSLDPDADAKDLKKLNFKNKRYYGIVTTTGKIEVGNKFKIDYQSQNSDLKNIKDVHINFNMPEVKQNHNGFYMVDDIRGKSGTANISYKDGTKIVVSLTNIARDGVGQFRRNGMEEIHFINPRALKYSSNSYFMGLSGTVAKILLSESYRKKYDAVLYKKWLFLSMVMGETNYK